MPRKKVSTILDEHLFRRAKLEAARQGKQLSTILGDALDRYLSAAGTRRSTAGIVAESWGVLKLDRRTVNRLMTQEGVLDA